LLFHDVKETMKSQELLGMMIIKKSLKAISVQQPQKNVKDSLATAKNIMNNRV